MDHGDVRTMLSTGALTPEAQRHLRACRSCREWNANLDRVRTLAPEVWAPPAPPGLAERSIAAARQWRRAPEAPVAVAVPAIPWWRRVWGRAALAAALAGAVAAGALTIPGRDEAAGPRGITLVAAAEKTADAKTARVRFSGDARATFEIDLPEIPAPAFPDEFLRNLDRMPQEMREEFERNLERMREAGREAVRSVPETMRFVMRMRATGEVVFPDLLHLRGTMTPEGDVPLPIGGRFELIVIGEDAWIRMAVTGEKWVKIPAATSPFRLTFKPGELLDLMRAQGRVEDLGEETLDGERVRHFRLLETFSEPTEHAAHSSFWIGVADGVLRKAEMSSKGRASSGPASSTFSSRGEMQLFDFGADVSVAPPPADQVTDGAELFSAGALALGVGDAGFSFSISLSAPARVPPAPRPSFDPETFRPSPPPQPESYPTSGSYSHSYSTGNDEGPPEEPSPPAEPSPPPS